jgi:hypothetical protein
MVAARFHIITLLPGERVEAYPSNEGLSGSKSPIVLHAINAKVFNEVKSLFEIGVSEFTLDCLSSYFFRILSHGPSLNEKVSQRLREIEGHKRPVYPHRLAEKLQSPSNTPRPKLDEKTLSKALDRATIAVILDRGGR